VSEKTHDPTPQRLREARKKGQIARSRMLGPAAATLGGLLATVAMRDSTVGRLKELTVSLLGHPRSDLHAALLEATRALALCAAPTLSGALGGALVASVATAGFQFNAQLISPDLSRIDPAAGFKRLFTMRQVVDLLKGLLVAALIGAVVWSKVKSLTPSAFAAVLRGDGASVSTLVGALAPVLIAAAVLLLVLALGDYLLARRRHLEDLRMSHQEVKQEHKSSEGDPHHKAKRKSLHRQLAAGGPARGVQKASVVVVNPTHIAVALRYDEAECDAPYIVAKAREEDALKIRKHAYSLGIPVVKDIPLARTLVHYDVGEEVPEELYQAAAAVLKVAQEQSEAADRRAEEAQS